MKNKTVIITISLIIILYIVFISIVLTNFFCFLRKDKELKKLGLGFSNKNIEYTVIFDDDIFGGYKIFKINDISKSEYRKILDNSTLWSKNKFYEYIVKDFNLNNDEENTINMENELYYYNKGNIYAIFDLTDNKIYYYKKNKLHNSEDDFSFIEGIEIDNYIDKEIYSVRGGFQNDGVDYFVYKFNEEKGNHIKEILKKDSKWQKNIDFSKINHYFNYNPEISNIKNGYYFYEDYNRTSEENAVTGGKVIVYDADNNILYYYLHTY